MNVGEIKSVLKRWGDTENQHMPVLGFHFSALKNRQTVLFAQVRVVRFVVELTMFGQHKAVNGDVLSTDPLTVVLHFGAAIIGFDGVGM